MCEHKFELVERSRFPGKTSNGRPWHSPVCVKCGLSNQMFIFMHPSASGCLIPNYAEQVREFYQAGKARYRAKFEPTIEERLVAEVMEI